MIHPIEIKKLFGEKVSIQYMAAIMDCRRLLPLILKVTKEPQPRKPVSKSKVKNPTYSKNGKRIGRPPISR